MFSCDKVITIPQYKETCWFNAILMALFYSQHSRKLFYHHFEGKKDKFSRIMNNIMKQNYIKTEQTIEYFKFMKPENILRYINIENKKDFYKIFKEKKSYGYKFINSFLPYFLKSLDKNILDIIIYKNNFYANYYSMTAPLIMDYKPPEINRWIGISKNPEYIIVNKITGSDDNLYKQLFTLDYEAYPFIEQILNLKNHNIDIKGLLNLNDEIYYNGNKYVLDSIILINYNNLKIGHAISGITCKNKRYVYNGWMRTTNDAALTKNISNRTLPCELMEFNWNIKKDHKFCLNPNLCKLDPINLDEHCFSFKNINKATLIYVRANTAIKSIDTNISTTSSITLPSLKSNSSNFSEVNLHHDLSIKKIMYIYDRTKRRDTQNEYKKTLKELKGLKGPKKECNKFTYDTSYIDCILVAFFNNKNLTIEELFFNNKSIKNKHVISIINEFKSYYENKTFNKKKLIKAIQMYYNDFIKQNPEYPKIIWSRGVYNFTDIIILLQQIFNFKKKLIEILLAYNEKFKIISKQETTIKTIKITKLKLNPEMISASAIIARSDNKYKCFYKCYNEWYDNDKIIKDIYNHIKSHKYKIVSCVYY